MMFPRVSSEPGDRLFTRATSVADTHYAIACATAQAALHVVAAGRTGVDAVEIHKPENTAQPKRFDTSMSPGFTQ
jgi:hypothetical protein